MTDRPRCKHCVRNLATPGRRGLCLACHQTPAVLALYPSGNPRATEPEPTEAELEAMIAEQMKSLPPWWTDDAEADRRREDAIESARQNREALSRGRRAAWRRKKRQVKATSPEITQ